MIQVDIVGIDADTKKTWLKTVSLPKNAVVADALAAVGLNSDTEAALFNDRTQSDRKLSDGDRIDVLSLLTVDPMTARRLRIEGQTQAKEMQRGRHGGKHRLAVI